MLLMVIFTLVLGFYALTVSYIGTGDCLWCSDLVTQHTYKPSFLYSNLLCLFCWCVRVCVCMYACYTSVYCGLSNHRGTSCNLAQVKCALIQTERYERRTGSSGRAKVSIPPQAVA